MSTKVFSAFLFILSVLVTFSCKKDDPVSHDDKTSGGNLSLFGKNSYFPIIENATWTYNFGEAVKIVNVDAAKNTFQIVNVGVPQGSMDGYSGKDGLGVYVTYSTWATTSFLPVRDYFGFTPLMYENSIISTSLQWSDSDISGGYPYKNQCTISSLSADITTPGKQIYNNCIVLKRDITYSNGYDWNPYLTQVSYYVQQGVGFVAEVKTWSNGAKDTNYVTSYTIP